MDVIFKIAGGMILIIIILIALTALVNAWPDIIFSISNFLSQPEEENKENVELFKQQVSDILKYKGHYAPEQKLRVYDDQNITIYENKRIIWKHKDGNPAKDYIDYIDQLHQSYLRKEKEMAQSIQAKARKLLSSSDSFQHGNLRVYSGERDTTVKIFVDKQLVFCHDSLGDKISTHRPGKWEEELDRIFRKRLDYNEDKIPELYFSQRATKRKEAEEERRNFSPIDDAAYFE